MPYLEFKNRKDIDDCGARDVYNKFEQMELKEFAGALNYLNFKIVKRYIKRNGLKYFTLAVITGSLTCCINEIYRKIASPYEEEKISSNGDIS